MREVVGMTGEGEGEVRERGGGSLPVCLCLLAAVNLAVMMIVTQLPMAAPGVEQLVKHGVQPEAVYRVQSSGAGYAFRSCAGGDSVNCHSDGNIAGL